MTTYPLSIIVSVCKNRLVCGFDEYRDFLNHVTGEQLPLWDVERARAATAKYLLATHKPLTKLPNPPDKTDSGNAGKYVRECAKVVGVTELDIKSEVVQCAPRTLAKAIR